MSVSPPHQYSRTSSYDKTCDKRKSTIKPIVISMVALYICSYWLRKQRKLQSNNKLSAQPVNLISLSLVRVVYVSSCQKLILYKHYLSGHGHVEPLHISYIWLFQFCCSLHVYCIGWDVNGPATCLVLYMVVGDSFHVILRYYLIRILDLLPSKYIFNLLD